MSVITKTGLHREVGGGKARVEFLGSMPGVAFGYDSQGRPTAWECETGATCYGKHIAAERVDPPAPPPVDVGEGWRRLAKGDLIEIGDEWLDDVRGEWMPCDYRIGTPFGANVGSGEWLPHRRRIPQPFRISTHGCGVYETRDGREANVTLIKSGGAFSYPASGTVAGCAGEYTWTDEGQESAVFKARRDLVRYLRPLPSPEPQWTPTCELRWKQPLRGWAGVTPAGAQMLNTLEQRWTCGDREEWRAVEIVK